MSFGFGFGLPFAAKVPAAAGGGGGWNPSALPSVQDYWDWSVLSSLKMADGTTQVTAFTDPVGKWIGQIAGAPYTRDSTPQCPLYAANGLAFMNVGGYPKALELALAARGQALPFTLAFSVYHPTSGLGDIVGTMDTLTDQRHTFFDAGYASNATYTRIRGGTQVRPAVTGVGVHRYIMTCSGSAASVFIDGVKTPQNPLGAETANIVRSVFNGYSGGTPSFLRRAALTYAALSDEDGALLDTWLAAGAV